MDANIFLGSVRIGPGWITRIIAILHVHYGATHVLVSSRRAHTRVRETAF